MEKLNTLGIVCIIVGVFISFVGLISVTMHWPRIFMLGILLGPGLVLAGILFIVKSKGKM